MRGTNLQYNFHDGSHNGTQQRQVRNIQRRNNRGESSCWKVSSHSTLNDNLHARDHGLNTHTSRNMVDFFQQMSSFHQAFRAQLDKLSIVQMCSVCHESYPGMNVFR